MSLQESACWYSYSRIGAYSVVLAYNDGAKGIFNVLDMFVLRGTISEISAPNLNKDRITRMERKSSKKGKQRRKKLQSQIH